ncbi:MAG: hypothetical protein U0992_05030 [Planctomycetaceae bacterium]
MLRGLPPHQITSDCIAPTFRIDFDQAGQPVALLVDGRPHQADLPVDAPLAWQFDTLTTLHVAQYSPHVFVHAGVVRYRGRAILLPGRSFAGKTTLTAALLAAGADYYSDDFAVIAADGRVLPYHCPLRMRTPDGRIEQSAADFGSHAAHDPVKPLLVVDTEYRSGGDWQPVRLSAGECVLRLFANAPAARIDPQRVGSALARVARDAICLGGPRGDAAKTAQRILEFCDELFCEPDTHICSYNERSIDAAHCPN